LIGGVEIGHHLSCIVAPNAPAGIREPTVHPSPTTRESSFSTGGSERAAPLGSVVPSNLAGMSPSDTPDEIYPSAPPSEPSKRTDGQADAPDDAQRAEALRELQALQARLLDTPVEVIIANHAYGLFELASAHLAAKPPRLDSARVAIDALGGLVDAAGDRLAAHAPELADALAQIRLAWVQISAVPPGTEA